MKSFDMPMCDECDVYDSTEAQVISNELGLHVAVTLCQAYGGRTLYVPGFPSAVK